MTTFTPPEHVDPATHDPFPSPSRRRFVAQLVVRCILFALGMSVASFFLVRFHPDLQNGDTGFLSVFRSSASRTAPTVVADVLDAPTDNNQFGKLLDAVTTNMPRNTIIIIPSPSRTSAFQALATKAAPAGVVAEGLAVDDGYFAQYVASIKPPPPKASRAIIFTAIREQQESRTITTTG